MKKDIFIASACRTPLGGFCGVFRETGCVQLAKFAIDGALSVLGSDIEVSEVIMGCVLSAGVGQAPARQAAIASGISDKTPCLTVNKVCGSGMLAVMCGVNSIIAEQANCVVAGGMENMSMAPYLLEKGRCGYRFGHGKLVDHMVADGLEDAYSRCTMGQYAENVAVEYNFSREMVDEFAKESYAKAIDAISKNYFNNEIVDVSVKDGKQCKIIEKDEIPFSANFEKMKRLRRVFKTDGVLTAASSSGISDGAAALVIADYNFLKTNNLEPLARIISQSEFSQNPELFATAPIGAIKNVLKKSNWCIKDVDLWEINEAFSVVPMAAISALDIPRDRVNVCGGACALGHPLGASGARIIVTLIHALRRVGQKRGLAALCIGGGEGVAMTFEMC